MKKLAFLLFGMFMVSTAMAAAPLALKTQDFQQLKVRGHLNVEYVSSADSAGLILISGPVEEYLSRVEASGSGRKLTLNLQMSDVETTPANLPSVRVYSSYLTKVENDGDSTVVVNSPAAGARFSATVTGNGRISVRDIKAGEVKINVNAGHGIAAVSGDCNKAVFNVNGAGVVQADALRATEADIWAAGTGNIGVWAVKNLKIKGLGSGTIFIKGTPHITQKNFGLKIQMIE